MEERANAVSHHDNQCSRTIESSLITSTRACKTSSGNKTLLHLLAWLLWGITCSFTGEPAVTGKVGHLGAVITLYTRMTSHRNNCGSDSISHLRMKNRRHLDRGVCTISLPFPKGHAGWDREQTPQHHRSQHREQSRNHRQAGEHWYRTALQLHRTCFIKLERQEGQDQGVTAAHSVPQRKYPRFLLAPWNSIQHWYPSQENFTWA